MIMAVMMVWMPLMAQHPFTLTTESDITNGTQNYYLIQSIDRSTFYAIPHSDAESSKVSTTSIPNANMRWYFMDAGSDSNYQYYYIVNSTGRCLYRYDDNNDGIKIKNTYAELSSLSDEELNKYKYYLQLTGSNYYIHPKGEASLYLNKRGGNVQYENGYYFKSSTYSDEPSKWRFVAVNDVTWTQPITVSTNVDKHYYKFQNVTNTSFYLSNSGEWATVSSTDSNENIWYFLEGGVDATYSNCHYYYIVNASTEKYLYYTGGTGNDVAKVMDYDSDEADNYRFLIVDAAYKVNNNYTTGYTIVPKLRQANFSDKDSFAPIAMNDNSHLLLKNDRGSGNYNSHWGIMETEYVGITVEAPTITNNDGTITLSTTTPGATIYYTTNGDIPDNNSTEYSSPFDLGDATVIKAIAYLGSDFSNVSIYNVPQSNDYSQHYLTFNVLTDGTICWKAFGTGYERTIEYSINNGSWTSIASTSAGATFDVNENDVVRFRGNNTSYAGSKSDYSGFEGGTATFDIEGNIHSLLYGDDFLDNNSLTNSTYQFCSLFKKALVISAENLILPATTLKDYCYRALFSWCTTLEKAPVLPATTLAKGCYWYMFEKCAITTAPELLSATLVQECYGNMFNACSNLIYIKCTAANGFSATNALTNWVSGVASTGTFVKDIDTDWATGASGIPSGWDVVIAELVDPVITCDGELITITCQTYGADIFYRFGDSGDFTQYEYPILITSNVTVQAYAEKSGLRSNTVSEECIATKTYRFAGMKITPGPLYYGSNGYEIKDGWNYNSYNSVYGKTVGSTYFNFIELGQLFESSVFSASDGDIEKVLDPLDGWRVPTNAEWASIIGTTRSGSTVNEIADKHYAMIHLADATGLLIFPDGETITGATLSNMDNTTANDITESQLDEYLSQGCIFLPGSGYYDGSLQTWDDGLNYWSSTEYDSSTGYESSGDNKDKGAYYLPVYLVKNAADETTRLLKTWTYNGNEVELPYSVNAIDGHSSSYKRSTFNFTTDVKIKESQPTYLWFQHADQSADIYVNNVNVTTHWGGYTSFFVDITNYLHLGNNNIKVTLCNTKRNTLAPYTGDFNMNATLGEVKLISSPVVPNPNYGYDGFHITSTVTAASASITVKTTVPTDATVTCSINGENCNYSETLTSTGVELTFTTDITDPHLWNGISDPYLYDVTLTIAKDGVVYHQFKRGYGLRFYEYVVDNDTPANSRFMLNGSPYLLRGVCMHNDLEGKANALTAADMDNDFEILKELGCNFVRLAHYPHPKEVYDRCDKMGIIVQTEAPCVNDFQSTLPQDYYDHLYIQYDDMVRQHFNHPCIMFWGLGNEIKTDDTSFSKTKLEAYRTFIKAIDAERWVGYVVDHGKSNPSSSFGNPVMDWFGCNIYVGWYIDQNSNNPTNRLNDRLSNTLTSLHKPLAFSEYGCGGTQHCHSDDFMSTTTRGNNPRHDIEYQMWLHEGHIAAIKNKPELLFTSQWQLFDIAVSNRAEGYKVCLDGETVSDNEELKRLNNKGLVERDHKTKKDPFYLYKAWWNQTDKFVHICGKDYEKSTGRVIKCYTNDGSTLTLFVNGVEIETVTVTDNIATFTATNFNPGDVIRVDGETSNDTFTFTNFSDAYVFTTDGNWDEAANWKGNTVPADGSDVAIVANAIIPSGYTVNADNVSIYYGSSLTIADGGQLYHNNDGVTATVQKDITHYTVLQNQGNTKTDGWYLIGYSFANNGAIAEMDNLLENEYDLFYYDEPTHYWRNHMNAANNFTELEAARGYLYANSQDITIGLKGTLNASDAMVNEPLSHSISAGSLKGFNLVGNPFVHNVTAYTGTSIAEECYRMNDTRTDLIVDNISDSNPLKTGEGFFVKATADNASVTFNSGAKDEMKKTGRIKLEIRENDKLIDRLIVKYDGEPLKKLTLNENGTKIFAMRDNQEMAVVPIEGNMLPVYFETDKSGTYTISLSTENTTLYYLHLIDNKTDDDIDLLQTPSYSFNARTMDYADRFKLVFYCGDANDDNKTFAFINNGNIIITANVEDATLQVIDVMGRLIVSRNVDVLGNVPTSGMIPGTYILRLIDGDNIRTQKIVIR